MSVWNALHSACVHAQGGQDKELRLLAPGMRPHPVGQGAWQDKFTGMGCVAIDAGTVQRPEVY